MYSLMHTTRARVSKIKNSISLKMRKNYCRNTTDCAWILSNVLMKRAIWRQILMHRCSFVWSVVRHNSWRANSYLVRIVGRSYNWICTQWSSRTAILPSAHRMSTLSVTVRHASLANPCHASVWNWSLKLFYAIYSNRMKKQRLQSCSWLRRDSPSTTKCFVKTIVNMMFQVMITKILLSNLRIHSMITKKKRRKKRKAWSLKSTENSSFRFWSNTSRMEFSSFLVACRKAKNNHNSSLITNRTAAAKTVNETFHLVPHPNGRRRFNLETEKGVAPHWSVDRGTMREGVPVNIVGTNCTASSSALDNRWRYTRSVLWFEGIV